MRTYPGIYADGLHAIARGEADDIVAKAALYRVARVLTLIESALTPKGK